MRFGRHDIGVIAGLLGALALAGCESAMTSIEPAGPQSGTIMRLFWPMVGVLTGVYLVTVLALVPALNRSRRRERQEEAGTLAVADEAAERRARNLVAGAVIVTIVILFGIVVADFMTTRSLNEIAVAKGLRIRVIGHQWWWEAHYQDSTPSLAVQTANELHIPVGRPVLLSMTSGDVIHSFWIPELNGKKDLIPGYTNDLWIQADRPGVFEGQCGEFCGMQHAKMRLSVIAEPPEKYDEWIRAQRAEADTATDSAVTRGREVFLAGTCPMCHRVAGTSAGAVNGPDLTHVASRRTLAAGSLPNTRGALAGWILNPSGVKPGVRMPPNSMKSGDLDALLTYLQSLK
jgi:cytochrome c oxidase subunit II